jgi:GntR family transcriptional regulator/MocR family aminotransferase
MAHTVRTRRGRILRVEVDRDSTAPIYQQIYQSIRGDILSGVLAAGSRLPSTRCLASDLAVARSTVVQAFEQLRAEGYVEGVLGAGTRVAASLPERHLLSTRGAELRLVRRSPRVSTRARRMGELLAEAPTVFGRPPRAFRAGVPAVDVFPVDLWARLLARRWSRTTTRQLAYAEPFGLHALRTAIAEHLRAARGVRCVTEQVLVTNGSQQALDLIARTLLDPGDAAWLEDPGYHGARGVLTAAGARVIPVPVDGEGLVVSEGRRRASDARLAFVTPSRQLPLGMALSPARRAELLEWASGDGWIVEDDYDSDFRYAGQPVSALQGLDRHGCVLYVGTFSKVMFPAMRLGYVVVPESLVDQFAAARHFADYHSPYLEQAVMADFMVEGHFDRHIRRMRAVYQARKEVLLDAMRRELADELDPVDTDGGITLVAWLRGLDDVAVARAARQAGIDVLALAPFAIEASLRPGLLLGYSGVREEEITAGVAQLARVVRAVRLSAGARTAERRTPAEAAGGRARGSVASASAQSITR